jgi:integrase
MFDGRLQLYKRPGGRYWQTAARVGERRFRESTKEEDLQRAKDIAEEWYLDLRGKLRNGQIVKQEKTFKEAAEGYLREVRVLAATTRSPTYVEMLEIRMNKHLIPFFGDKGLSEINRGLVQSYRVKRAEETIKRTATAERTGKPPARSTMLQEIVHLRQTLKWAEGMGWIPFVPNLSQPYMTQGKRGRRAWFSAEEYKQLYTATRRRIQEGGRPGWKSHYEDMHDFVLFMANTGLRPDEALRLEIRDVQIEKDEATRETILVIDVRGKTGVGYCKSMPGAVEPFRRLRDRRGAERQAAKAAEGKAQAGVTGQPDAVSTEAPQPEPTGKVFRGFDRAMFNKILDEEGLKFDRDRQRRTAYSLRHTYISMRLMDGANIHQIANNCRTSVQMIEEFYAAHIKDRLDASAINVQRPKRRPARSSKPRSGTADSPEQLLTNRAVGREGPSALDKAS